MAGNRTGGLLSIVYIAMRRELSFLELGCLGSLTVSVGAWSQAFFGTPGLKS